MKQLLNSYPAVLREQDLIVDETNAVKDVWTELGKYKVPAGAGLAIGYKDGGQSDCPGRIYGVFKTAAAVEVKGLVRINLIDEQESFIATLFEGHTSQLNTSASDRTQQFPLPFVAKVATRDKYIQLQLKNEGAADAAVDVTNSDVLISCTGFKVAD